jgi:MFS family permease
VSGGFFIASIFMISYYFVETRTLTYLVSIGVSIALSVSPLMIVVLSKTSPKEHLGMSMGIFGSFEDLGAMIGPAIYGLVWASFQPGYIFIVSGVAQLISFQPGYIFIVSGVAQLISAFLALTLKNEEKTERVQ